MSIANRDSARECIERAAKFIKNGDLDKAERFLKNSIRLYPLDDARRLIIEIEVLRKIEQRKCQRSDSSNTNNNRKCPDPSTIASGTIKNDYSSEQEAEVQRILKLKNDYYKVLGVEKGSVSISENVLKKSYKKLAIQFHPDKNNAPHATEAFKLISSAYQCLSDPKKREIYDQFGTEDPAGQARFSQHRSDELTPEEVFQMFFGGGGAFQFRSRRNHGHHHNVQRNSSSFGNIIHLLPLVLILLVTFLNSQSSNDDFPFSLTSTQTYSISKTTHSGIPYFVDLSFQWHYERDRRAVYKIEQMVEQEFFKKLKTKCEYEKSEKNRKITDARQYRGKDQAFHLKKAEEIYLSSCDELNEWYDRITS